MRSGQSFQGTEPFSCPRDTQTCEVQRPFFGISCPEWMEVVSLGKPAQISCVDGVLFPQCWLSLRSVQQWLLTGGPTKCPCTCPALGCAGTHVSPPPCVPSEQSERLREIWLTPGVLSSCTSSCLFNLFSPVVSFIRSLRVFLLIWQDDYNESSLVLLHQGICPLALSLCCIACD